MRTPRSTLLVIIGLAIGLSAASFGEEKSQPAKAASKHGAESAKMTPELKKDMADMYQKMADCLRTEKTMEECSREAMKDCPVVAKTGHCPINEGTMGKRMGHPMGGMDMKNMKDKHLADGGE